MKEISRNEGADPRIAPSQREISFAACARCESRAGPRLHRHPYVETFLVHSGRALFTLGDEQVVVEGGQVIAAPALVAHRFEVLDGGTYNATHIHANDRFVTEWLE